MHPPTTLYTDVLLKQLIEDWGVKKGFDAEKTIALHMQERFEVETIRVSQVKEEGEQLILEISTEHWEMPREFALLSSGSLVW